MKKTVKILKIPALALMCFGIALPLAACGTDGDKGNGVVDVTGGGAGYDGDYDAAGADIGKVGVAAPDETPSAITDADMETSAAGAAELAAGGSVTVTEGGVYRLSGDYESVTVSAADEVRLVLDGARIASAKASPIKIKKNSGKVVITLLGENSVTDASTDGEDAAVYSATADVTFNGTGSLAVGTASNHGIQTKGTLIIAGGTFSVAAADNGIAGNTALEVAGGTLKIEAGGDAIKSKNGSVRLTDAAIVAESGGDGVDAATAVYIDADLDLTAGGGSLGDSGLTTSADWQYETLAADDFESGKTYYTLTGDTYEEYEETVYADGLYDRASCKAVKGENILVAGGKVATDSLDDGINADGVAAITGGGVTVATACDGIQGDAGVLIAGGELDVAVHGAYVQSADGNYTKSGNTYTRVDGDEVRGVTLYDFANSCKGVKSDGDVEVSGGIIAIDSFDNTIKADGKIGINGGTLVLSCPDHGVHAKDTLYITGGDVTVKESYDGLKGGRTYIDGGTLRVKSNDDGVSGAGGDDLEGYIEINGGNLYVDATGDGLDSNGDLVINGGIVVIDGPTDGGNGALDCGDGNYSVTVNGGVLVAAGSSQMAESPASASAAYSLVVGASLSAGSCLTLTTGGGSLTYVPSKAVQSVVVSSPLFASGTTVAVSTGGTLSGSTLLFGAASGNNGLYSGGTLTEATSLSSVTLSQKVTNVGSAAGGSAGGQRPDGNPGGRPGR